MIDKTKLAISLASLLNPDKTPLFPNVRDTCLKCQGVSANCKVCGGNYPWIRSRGWVPTLDEKRWRRAAEAGIPEVSEIAYILPDRVQLRDSNHEVLGQGQNIFEAITNAVKRVPRFTVLKML